MGLEQVAITIGALTLAVYIVKDIRRLVREIKRLINDVKGKK